MKTLYELLHEAANSLRLQQSGERERLINLAKHLHTVIKLLENIEQCRDELSPVARSHVDPGMDALLEALKALRG